MPISEGALGSPALDTALFLTAPKERGCGDRLVPSSEVGLGALSLLNACTGAVSESRVALRAEDALHRLESG